MTGATAPLDERERRVLDAVCDALLPALSPGPGDDPALFAASATAMGTPAAVEAAIAGLAPRQQRELRLFLRLLDNRVVMTVATARPRSFVALDRRQRAEALVSLANHPLPPLRSGFQALHRLANFLFYAAVNDTGVNPLWAPLGYALPPAVAGSAPVRVQRPERYTVIEADVCIVGSGAGGGIVAELVAAAGRRVVVLEAGPADQGRDFDAREVVGMQRLYLHRATTATRDLGVAILAGSALGGGTAINWQTSLPLPDYIRDEWAARSGIRAFAGDEFTRAMDAVLARCNAGTGESVRNANNAALQRGAEALGYRWSAIPRNAKGCDPSRCGFCVFGCALGAKQSTAVTSLRAAQQAGDVTVVTDCRAWVVRIEHGRATGVDADMTTPAGRRIKVLVKAGRVVVAAGALETPMLLMRSGVWHPELGRNLFLHPTTAVAGQYAHRIDGWMGPPQSVLCDELARLHGNDGARLETPPIHPGLFALALPWHGASLHRAGMQRLGHTAAFVVLSRDRNPGRVRPDREGNPLVDYVVGRSERRLLRHGMAAAARIHWAAGAGMIQTLHMRRHAIERQSPGASIDQYCDAIMRLPLGPNRCGMFSAHQMGTARMGVDPRTSVCDERGAVRGVRRLHVADASLFPASSGVNPMITIMALAHMIGSSVATG